MLIKLLFFFLLREAFASTASFFSIDSNTSNLPLAIPHPNPGGIAVMAIVFAMLALIVSIVIFVHTRQYIKRRNLAIRRSQYSNLKYNRTPMTVQRSAEQPKEEPSKASEKGAKDSLAKSSDSNGKKPAKDTEAEQAQDAKADQAKDVKADKGKEVKADQAKDAKADKGKEVKAEQIKAKEAKADKSREANADKGMESKAEGKEAKAEGKEAKTEGKEAKTDGIDKQSIIRTPSSARLSRSTLASLKSPARSPATLASSAVTSSEQVSLEPSKPHPPLNIRSSAASKSPRPKKLGTSLKASIIKKGKTDDQSSANENSELQVTFPIKKKVSFLLPTGIEEAGSEEHTPLLQSKEVVT